MGLFRNNGDKFDQWADRLGQKMVAWGEKQMKRLEAQEEDENQRLSRRHRMEEMRYSRNEDDEDDPLKSDRDEALNIDYLEDPYRNDGPTILTYNQRIAREDASALQELKGAFETRWHEQVTATFKKYRKFFDYLEIDRGEIPYKAIKTQTVKMLAISSIFPTNDSWR